jgi:hypothetical protein
MTNVGEAAGRPTARPRVSRFGATTALIVAFVALAVVWAGMGAVTYRLATAPVRTNLTLTARLDGVLSAQANIDGTACFWVGNGTHRTALSWPWGYTAHGSPLAPALGWVHAGSLSRLAVYDEAGRRVAEVGQRVSMGGGLMGEEVDSILGCSGFPRFWGVGKVIGAR